MTPITDPEELKRRKEQLLSEEKDRPCRWWWLSFAGETGFRGGLWVLAPGFAHAVQRSHDLGLSPGGEVKGYELPEWAGAPPEEQQNRLLSKADLEATGGAAKMP